VRIIEARHDEVAVEVNDFCVWTFEMLFEI